MRDRLGPLFLLAACGGGGDGTPDDAPPPECLLGATLGVVTPGALTAGWGMGPDGMPANYNVYVPLNEDEAPDNVLIDLYKGFGAFKAGWPTAPVTIELVGEETNYETCGACVLALPDITQDGSAGDPYIATAGTVTLEVVSSTQIKGTLSNLQFTQFTQDPASLVLTPNGCMSTLDSLVFDAVPDLGGGGI